MPLTCKRFYRSPAGARVQGIISAPFMKHKRRDSRAISTMGILATRLVVNLLNKHVRCNGRRARAHSDTCKNKCLEIKGGLRQDNREPL